MRGSDVRVLAIGATGQFAGLVVPALAAKGLQVRALVHDPAKADRVRELGADEAVTGDLRDRASIDAALRGVDGVFHVTPAFAPDSAELGVAMVEAATAAGVDRFVFSGVYHPALSLVNHASTRPIEEALYRSPLDFTVLQPAMFMQGLAESWKDAVDHGVFSMPYSKDSAMTFVDYRDVAEVAATAFVSNDLVGGTFELAAGGMITRSQIAELMSRHAGRTVVAQDVDPDVALSGMPAGQMRDGLQAMFADYTAHGFHGGNNLALRTILDRSPRTLDSYFAELAASGSDHPDLQGDMMTTDPTPPPVTIPPDDPSRRLTVARPDQDQSLLHVGLVGDTYTILVSGDDTAGIYTLIDMYVPPGGGPPPHRHDFEEMFTILEGEVSVTFRGETLTAHTGETINVPANAPHAFTNAADNPSRLLCLCAPAGQEEFFALVGQPVASRTEPPPPLDPAAEATFIAKSQSLAPRYRTELLPPSGAQ